MFVPAARLIYSVVRRSACGVIATLAMHGACIASSDSGIYLVDDGEALHLSDRSTLTGARLLVATRDDARTPAVATRSRSQIPRDERLTDIVRQAATSQRIPPELLHAVIATESAYALRAVSSRGAQGLMQLMPATAHDYGVTDPFDPRQNINAGARHLRRLLDQFGQDPTLALAAYNAGASAVLRHRQVPPFAETAAYVPRVLQRFAELRGASAPLTTTLP